MSQNGRPIPSTPVTVIWGASLGLIALALLLAGGQNALSGLQAMMVSMSLPFVIIMIGMGIAWARELIRDPVIIRRRYGLEAVRRGVVKGITEHGDDFVFGSDRVPTEEGAGATFDSEDESLTVWYTEHSDEILTNAPRERNDDSGRTGGHGGP